jgi:hypothetical protein
MGDTLNSWSGGRKLVKADAEVYHYGARQAPDFRARAPREPDGINRVFTSEK